MYKKMNMAITPIYSEFTFIRFLVCLMNFVLLLELC